MLSDRGDEMGSAWSSVFGNCLPEFITWCIGFVGNILKDVCILWMLSCESKRASQKMDLFAFDWDGSVSFHILGPNYQKSESIDKCNVCLLSFICYNLHT